MKTPAEVLKSALAGAPGVAGINVIGPGKLLVGMQDGRELAIRVTDIEEQA